MALSVIAVSSTVSPLAERGRETDMFMTSAPRRLPASSNEVWVRVEASKNRLIWVRPRRGRLLLVDLAVELDVAVGQTEQGFDFGDLERFDSQKVLAFENAIGSGLGVCH